MTPLTRDAVTRLVHTDADALYRIVSDVTRTPQWSPEVIAARWENPTQQGVGARFAATNRRRWLRWTNHPVVVAADPGRVFAFARTERGGGTLQWTYHLAPVPPRGTSLTLGYEVTHPVPAGLHVFLKLVFRVDDLAEDLHQNMATSLDRIAALASPTRPA
jgi:hypothetical protein